MRATAGLAMCLLLGCQTYDFEPVTPLGVAQTVKQVTIGVKQPKPNMFLVVDKSGSMRTIVSGTTTRMDALQSAMDSFLDASGQSVHLGLLPFPSNDACGAGDVDAIASVGVPLDLGDDDDARMKAYAGMVKTAIDNLDPLGGTPTGATIRGLAKYTPLLARDRSNFAVLMTDGLPNCNPDLDSVRTSCTCTTSGLVSCNSGTSNLCLDDSGSANEIALLKGKGVTTIVIGFGTDVQNATGAQTLRGMAAAGGFNRPCTSSADCNSGDTCNPGGTDPCGRPASTCGQSFFQASNATDLGHAMDLIKASLECPVCRQVLNVPPSKPDLISVYVDGDALSSGNDTWIYHDDPNSPVVEFVGATCDKISASSTANPVKVEIRTVEAL